MYTVIIQSRETAAAGRDFRRLFFSDLIESGQVGFCMWEKDGDSVKTVVPDLYRLIAGKREWQAIIVQSEEDRCAENAPGTTEDNPFDFLANADSDVHTVEESNIPLIRLVHILCGIPEPEIKYDTEIRREATMAPHRVYVPDRERYRAEMMAHKGLTVSKSYLFTENRPDHVYLISTRRPVDNTGKEIAAAWNMTLESASSEFWNRNRYPSKCRFMVYDTLNREHSLYGGSVFKFWTIILLLTINHIPPSSLQAYRLYRVDTELDEKRLSEILTSFYDRLREMTLQMNAAEAVRESVGAQAAKTAPKFDETVGVVFSVPNDRDLFIPTKGLGYTTETPQSEISFWVERYRKASVALHNLLRIPMRALDVAADDTRRKGTVPQEEVELLNRYQISDVEDVQQSVYFRVLEGRKALGFNLRKREKERSVIDDQVRQRISQRLDKSRLKTGLLVALIATFVGMIPYLIYAGMKDISCLLWALLVVVLIMGVSAAACLIEIWIQRKEMADTMEDHNRCMAMTKKEIQESARHYSDYLTELCKYLRARSYLDQEAKMRSGRLDIKHQRKIHRKAVQRYTKVIQDWSNALGAPIVQHYSGDKSFSFDPLISPDENPAYSMTGFSYPCQIELTDSGATLQSPFDFVINMTLEREELYDDVDSDKLD